MHRLFLIIFSLLLVCLETTTATTGNQLAAVGGRGDDNKCLDKERLALLQFKSGLHDPYSDNGCLSTWWTAEEEDCCYWTGVACNNQTGHVIELRIRACGLVGKISHSLLNLTYLNRLDLFDNSFHGTIPKFIGSMTHLKYLDLGFNSFHGIIPKFIGSMTQLKYLDLSFNSFHGIVPPELVNLTNLQVLQLDFVGRCRVENIEWLSRLSHLEVLAMDGISLAKQNHWVDLILSLRNLSYLSLHGCELSQVMHPYSSSFLKSSSSSIESLYLSNNNLNSSTYRWLFPLTSNKLRLLSLSRNMLVVEFPVFLNNLSGCTSLALQVLDVSYNHLTGSLPDEIQKFPSLMVLGLSHNQLNGTISEKLWELPNLQTLQLSSNYLRGAISENIGKSKLLFIDLSSNNISGKVPNVSNIVMSLDLSRNNFSGGISFLCQIVSGVLQLLDLSQNFLRGPVPDCLWQFTELTVLNLGNNNLSGRLPASVKSLSKLEVLDLYNNEFSGVLPLSLQNCTRLNVLNLGANKFSGNVPIWIGENLSGLYVLILTSNNFFGTIPLQLCQLANLQILDLSMNNLHGFIPSRVNNLTAMVQEGPSENQNQHFYGGRGFFDVYVDHEMIEWQGDEREFFSNLILLKMIDLSSNNLTGQIPYEITKLHELIALNLSKNALHGEIPQKIGQMKNLLVLDLSRNKFSGSIPSSMSQMTSLSYLDVSSNNLSGRIPSSTQLQSFDSSRYDGNVGLCGLPLPQKCPGDEELEPEVPSVVGKSEGDGEDNDEDCGWFYIGIGTGFATGFWIVCGTLLLNRRGRHAFFHFYDSFKDWVYVKCSYKRR